MLMVILTVAVFVASCSGSNGNAVSPNGDGGRQEGSATVDSSVDVLVDSAGVPEVSANLDSSADSRADVLVDSAGVPEAGKDSEGGNTITGSDAQEACPIATGTWMMTLTYQSGNCPSYVQPVSPKTGAVTISDLEGGTIFFYDDSFCSTQGTDYVSPSCAAAIGDNVCFNKTGTLSNGDTYRAYATMTWQLTFGGLNASGIAVASMTILDTMTHVVSTCMMNFNVSGNGP